MNQTARKRVTGASLNQYLGQSVTLLGEFVKLEPNGRIFTLKTSSNEPVTVQLQEPLCPDDSELFKCQWAGAYIPFYKTHVSDFERMWEEQGKTYWLRFLITFQLRFETFNTPIAFHKPDRMLDFAYISIHKQFVEQSCASAKNFLKNVFKAGESFNPLPGQILPSLLFSKEAQQALHSLFGKTCFDPEELSFIFTMYLNFISGVCIILSRWLKEADITEKDCIDYTLYYWKPPCQWEDAHWYPSCFEKYLSNFWTKDLPKMLLTCNVQHIFNTHMVTNDCCSISESGIFRLPENICKESRHLNVIGICKSEVAYCAKHSECFLKIQHDKCCLDPYLCLAYPPCSVTCETNEKLKSKPNVKDFWTKSSVEFFACKDKNKRSVSTYVESVITKVETFYPANYVSKNVHSAFHDMQELFFLNADSKFRNSYNQHKQKEEYRKKLRKKFNERYEENDFENPDYLEELYARAQNLWAREVCSFHNLVHDTVSNDGVKMDKCLIELKYKMRTKAIGTDSLVFGLLVKPRKLNLSLNVNTQDSIKMSQTRREKKKCNETTKVINSPVPKSDLNVAKSESKMPEKKVEVGVPDVNKDESVSLDKICDIKDKLEEMNDTNPLAFSSCDIAKDIGGIDNSFLTTDIEEDLKTFYNFVKTDVCEIDVNSKETESALSEFCEKSDIVPEIKKNKCKICAFCQKKEIQPKTFKRCSRCKTEHFKIHRYYCSRNCQIADWEKSHRDEHLNKITD